MRRESRAACSALSRLPDAREGLREQAVDVLASDARKGLKKAAAIRALPDPRLRVSQTRARG